MERAGSKTYEAEDGGPEIKVRGTCMGATGY